MSRRPSLLYSITAAAIPAFGMLLLTGCGQEQTPPRFYEKEYHIEASLTPDTVLVGDRAEVAVAITHPAGTHSRTESLNPAFDASVMTVSAPEVQTVEGKSLTTFTLQLQPMEVGSFTVFTNAVTFRRDGELLHEEPFPELILRVESLLTDTNAVPAEIKGLADYPTRFPRWPWVLALIALLAVLLALLAARLLRRKESTADEEIHIDPYQLAMLALRKLLGRGWIEEGASEPFYVELSGIVRAYLENRYDLHAPEQTTDEFIRTTAHSNLLRKEHRNRIIEFLTLSDLVKFARLETTGDEMREAFHAAETLIKETRPPAEDPS